MEHAAAADHREPSSGASARGAPWLGPRVTADLPGIGGVIKQRPEDFLVEEIPLYEPVGQGEHLYLFIEKRSLSTLQLVEVLAKHFHVARGAIGTAGLKDKRAITRQVVSVHVPGKAAADFPQIDHPRIGVLWADQHTNKLRRGHLAGNRFSIRVRGVEPTAVVRAQRIIQKLHHDGVPNRYGEQRFGLTGRNHLIGRALIRGDADEITRLLLGPSDRVGPDQIPFRQAFDAGALDEALGQMPPYLTTERAVLRELARGRSPARAVRAIRGRERDYFLSAAQSGVFNAVLDERIGDGSWNTLAVGDVAVVLKGRAAFDIDEATLAQADTAERLAAMDIAPSGPMWGGRMHRASGTIGDREVAALEAFGLDIEAIESFGRERRGTLIGARRPLRVPLIDPLVEGGVDEVGPFVRLAFELPRGAFATMVLDEVIKPACSTTPAG